MEHGKYSHMIMQFGQFLSHDITHAPLDQGPNAEALNCSRFLPQMGMIKAMFMENGHVSDIFVLGSGFGNYIRASKMW
ncbi:hypothetical protein NECAME_05509 [Necator americanus]|uniref:Animal hem peroxidase n=1 Tax=Necator americanus TaxID=51031 RepID=W2SGB4_NECAM|nr:hypothetical protein NECAME_05509 [Necator americanus]ETN68664.1 hypothetical protein NECAME_05509 [Necator americanus]